MTVANKSKGADPTPPTQTEAEELAELRALVRRRLIEAMQDPTAKASMVAQAVKFLTEAEAIEEPEDRTIPPSLVDNLPFPLTGNRPFAPRKPLGNDHHQEDDDN